MTKDPDVERIRRKAHELWEAEGHPHGRDLDHWEQAREIIALEDSQASTLLPRTAGAEEPSEPRLAVDSLGDVPGLTDQGRDDLLDTRREPAAAASAGRAGSGIRAKAKPAAQATGGKIAEKPATPRPAPSKPISSVQAAPKPGVSAPKPAIAPAPSSPPDKPSTSPGPAAAKVAMPLAKGPAPTRPKT